ncbi:hypothetical protein RJT34_31050 [Clitoria ternatea]|uniref:Homeobox domain-containing protein n=1 Tax=Clitoria ternatea TaxID=43366 RepID=A0AAN9ETM6_CLITE
MLLVNPNTNNNSSTTPTNALNLANFSHAPPPPSPNNHHRHQLIGVTVPSSGILGSTSTTDHMKQSFLGHHEISGFQGLAPAATSASAASPRVHYNLWDSVIDQSTSTAVTASTNTSSLGCLVSAATTDASTQTGFHRPNTQQGLSLSLSSQQTPFRLFSGEVQALSLASRGGGDDMRVMNSGVSSMHSVVLDSKYLKATQELLDEVVNVGKGISKGEESMEGARKEKMKGNIESTSCVGDGSSGGGENSGGKRGVELSTAQRQELQMKKSKLVTMLDEVEQRYRQYHHQMQIVIASFERVAGIGAAKSYTALALRTISKQFRSLKDAISSQIRTTSKTLGEDDCLGVKVEGSRLRYVDHHLRQQRALQQLGMIQHNAWRPQRGLPERAVSILRAWLFEHFLHPYPKDSDKVMLAKQTGLTRSQVSNWFINARVRLWKPMVEEMYLEEVKQEGNSQDTTNNRSKESNSAAQESAGPIIRHDQINILHSKAEESFNNSPTEISNSNSLSTSPIPLQSGFHLVDMQSPNKPIRSSEMHNSPGRILSADMEMKPHHGDTIMNNNRDSNTKFGIENHGGGGFGAFSIEDIGRFNVTDQQFAPRFHGNGVSLTLALPHSENLPHQHGFLSHLGMGTNENDDQFCAINTTAPSSAHSSTSYETIDIQNRKRFAAQLLRDFVA